MGLYLKLVIPCPLYHHFNSLNFVGLFRHLLLLLFILQAIPLVLAAQVADTALVNRLIDRSKQLQRVNQDSSFLLAQQGIKIARSLNYKKGIASCEMRIGSIYYTSGAFDSALYFIQDALDIRTNLHDLIGASGAQIMMSYIYQSTGKQELAFKALYEALRLSKEGRDSINQVQTYVTIGNLKFDYGEKKEALENYTAAAKLAEAMHYTDGIVLAYDGIGHYYSLVPDFMLALVYFQQIDSLTLRNGDVVSNAQNKSNIGFCYENLNRYQLAKIYYIQAINACQQLDMSPDLATGYNSLGGLYVLLNKGDSAIYFLSKSLQIGTALHELNTIARSYELLAKSYALQKKYDKAFYYQTCFTNLKDSILNNEKVKQIAEMQTKYETVKKEKEIELLNEQNHSKAIQRNLFIVALVLMILLGGVIYNRYLLKKKSNAALLDAMQELKATQQQLVLSEKRATYAAIATRVAHEVLNPLNFVNNFSQIAAELVVEVEKASPEEQAELLELLKANVLKIHGHGKRAEEIVKVLLAHTRSGTTQEFFENKESKNTPTA